MNSGLHSVCRQNTWDVIAFFVTKGLIAGSGVVHVLYNHRPVAKTLRMGQPERTHPLIVAQFLGMGVAWGASFLFIKVGLESVSVAQVVLIRDIVGAATLGVYVLVTRQRFPREPIVWLHFFVLGAVYCVIPYLLFAWAEQSIASSLASIYDGSTPIAVAIFAAVVFRIEKLDFEQIVGVALGVVGVVVIASPWTSAIGGALDGQLACVIAVACYGVSFGYIRRFISSRDISGSMSAFLNVGMGAVIMLVLAPWIASQPIHHFSWPSAVSLLVLGGVGTGIAYLWNMNVLREWSPTASASVTYLIPVVGVLLGVLILRERLSWNEPIGAAVVLIAILFTQGRIPLRRAAANEGA